MQKYALVKNRHLNSIIQENKQYANRMKMNKKNKKVCMLNIAVGVCILL